MSRAHTLTKWKRKGEQNITNGREGKKRVHREEACTRIRRGSRSEKKMELKEE
jgi:hypothetical protein